MTNHTARHVASRGGPGHAPLQGAHFPATGTKEPQAGGVTQPTAGIVSVAIIEGGPGSALPAFVWQLQEAINVQLVDDHLHGFGLGVVFEWAGDVWQGGPGGTRVRVLRQENVVEVKVRVPDELAWRTKEPRRGLLVLLATATAQADHAAHRAKVPFDAERYLDAMQGAADIFDLAWQVPTEGLDAVRLAMPEAEAAESSREAEPSGEGRDIGELLAADQVVLTFPISTKEQMDTVLKLEEAVEPALTGNGSGFLDGNEIGDGTFALFLMGVDEDRFKAVVLPLLRRFGYCPESYTLSKGPVTLVRRCPTPGNGR